MVYADDVRCRVLGGDGAVPDRFVDTAGAPDVAGNGSLPVMARRRPKLLEMRKLDWANNVILPAIGAGIAFVLWWYNWVSADTIWTFLTHD